MFSTLFPKGSLFARKSTTDVNTLQPSRPVSEKETASRNALKATISSPTLVVLGPNDRPESEASSASGATFGTVSEKAVVVPCGICRKSFDAHNPQALFAHLGGHFDRRYEFNRCEDCQINFISQDDLQKHLHHVSEYKSCGFMFQHRQPCTGHHPPRRRELRDDSRFDFCYRLQRWESTQVEANQATRSIDEALLEAPATSNRTFSMGSLSDIMRMSRLSRLPKLEDVEKALEEKPAVVAKDALGAALLRAICTANLDLVASFIDAGANLEIQDALGFGAMHYNAQYGTPEIGWLLLQAGADPNTPDRRGRSPLLHAIVENNSELVHYFLAWGAQPETQEMRAVVSTGNAENLELLLEWWIHNEKPRETLDSLLILAVKQQDRDVAEVLLENGAHATATDDSGNTVLSIAADTSDRPVTMLLLEHGAEPDGWTDKDERPLAEVVKLRHFAMAEMLCAKVA